MGNLVGFRKAGFNTRGNSAWTCFTTMSFYIRVVFADEMLFASRVSWFHNNVPLGIKVSACVIYSSLKLLFQAVICVLGPAFPWKKRRDSDSPIGPEAAFPFCNLRLFFTFVPSIGSAYVWFVASFWVICSAFPTHNFGGSISHGACVGTDDLPFLLFGNNIPCFPLLLWVSAGFISVPAMAVHSDNKAYAGLFQDHYR